VSCASQVGAYRRRSGTIAALSRAAQRYYVLRDGQSYRELGGDYFDRLNTDCLTRYHTKRLAALGYTVTLAKHAA